MSSLSPFVSNNLFSGLEFDASAWRSSFHVGSYGGGADQDFVQSLASLGATITMGPSLWVGVSASSHLYWYQYRTETISGTDNCYQVPSMKQLLWVGNIRFMSKYDVPSSYGEIDGNILFLSMTQIKESDELFLVQCPKENFDNNGNKMSDHVVALSQQHAPSCIWRFISYCKELASSISRPSLLLQLVLRCKVIHTCDEHNGSSDHVVALSQQHAPSCIWRNVFPHVYFILQRVG